MHPRDPIRCWQRPGVGLCRCLCLCGLLCLGFHALAREQSGPTTPTKATQASSTNVPATRTAKAKHPIKRPPTHTSAQNSKISHGKRAPKRVAKKRGQQAIDSERAREIQTALIREHYMDGEASGSWDSATQAAMQRYQADQGWQSKTTPDSRALIKLGLGPTHDHLLNPESAMTMPTAPAAGDPKAASKQTPPADNIPKQ